MKLFSNCNAQIIKIPIIPLLLSYSKSSYKYIVELQRTIIFDAWSISNDNRGNDTDSDIKVLYVGKIKTNKKYFCNLLFKENFESEYLGKVRIWKLFFYLWGFQKKYDLIVVNGRLKFWNIFKSNSVIVIPEWVDCEIDLNCDIGSRCISKKTFKYNLKKIQRGNFRYSITKDKSDFDFFYYHMHLPYVSKRHGESAIKMSYADMKKSFDNGELLQIKEGQNTVAGVIIDYKIMNEMPRITKLGVLGGEFSYVKRGALIALYYYTIEYLKENNYTRFSLGSTRPFFSDGILRHKLNWGAKITCDTSMGFLLSVASKKKYLKDFFSSNPFIIQNKKNLNLAVFPGNHSKACQYLPSYKNKLKLIGLDKIANFSL